MARPSTFRSILTAALGVVVFSYAGLVGMRVLWPLEYWDIVRKEAQEHETGADLVASVIFAESRFRADALSARGAVGLMQILPETALWIAEMLDEAPPSPEDLTVPALNVRFGTWYLQYLLRRYRVTETALAAYNAGPSAVDRWLAGEGDRFPETDAFVGRVASARPIYRFYFRFPALQRIVPSLGF